MSVRWLDRLQFSPEKLRFTDQAKKAGQCPAFFIGNLKKYYTNCDMICEECL